MTLTEHAKHKIKIYYEARKLERPFKRGEKSMA
jgi:hypothetical protein